MLCCPCSNAHHNSLLDEEVDGLESTGPMNAATWRRRKNHAQWQRKGLRRRCLQWRAERTREEAHSRQFEVSRRHHSYRMPDIEIEKREPIGFQIAHINLLVCTAYAGRQPNCLIGQPYGAAPASPARRWFAAHTHDKKHPTLV